MSTIVHVDGCFNYLFRMGNFPESKISPKSVTKKIIRGVLTLKGPSVFSTGA
jgi:hypothetical protein